MIHVSLDIGTTSVKVIVAEIVNGELNVIGVGNEKSKGVSRGIIVDIDQTVDSIQRAVQQAEQKSGIEITDVIVGVPANGLEIESCHGMIGVSDAGNEIVDADIQNVVNAALIKSVPPERDILAVLPQEFVVDGFDGIRDPRGMIGVRLEMHALLFSSPKTILHNIKRCVEKAGYTIQAMVLQPLAMSSTALSAGESDFGTILLDLGGGQTTVSVVHDNQLKFVFVDQEGGEYLTKDISVVLNTAPAQAEKLKREYGYAMTEAASEENRVPVEVVGQAKTTTISERYLAEIIEARMLQIFEKIDAELKDIDAYRLPGGIVLSGGSSALPSTIELAEEIFGVNVKMYIPSQMGIRYPSFTTGIGLIKYVAEETGIQRLINRNLLGYHPQVSASQEGSETGPFYTVSEEENLTEEQQSIAEKGETMLKKVWGQFASFFE